MKRTHRPACRAYKGHTELGHDGRHGRKAREVKKRKNGFWFPGIFYEAIKYLPEHVQVETFHAIMEYGLNEKKPCGLEPLSRSLFTLMRFHMDAAKAEQKDSLF